MDSVGQYCMEQARPGKVRSGQVRAGHVRTGQDTTGQDRKGKKRVVDRVAAGHIASRISN